MDATSESSRLLGQLVRDRRRGNRLSQRQLGELAGVGVRFLSELERGKTTLRADSVNRVLLVFGLMLGAVEIPREESSTGELP